MHNWLVYSSSRPLLHPPEQLEANIFHRQGEIAQHPAAFQSCNITHSIPWGLLLSSVCFQ